MMEMEIKIPKTSLVLLIDISGSGRSSFAKKHFNPYEIISSDVCRGIIDRFDATNMQAEVRKNLLNNTHSFHILPVIIVFNILVDVCERRNTVQTDQTIPPYVLRQQMQDLRPSLKVALINSIEN